MLTCVMTSFLPEAAAAAAREEESTATAAAAAAEGLKGVEGVMGW